MLLSALVGLINFPAISMTRKKRRPVHFAKAKKQKLLLRFMLYGHVALILMGRVGICAWFRVLPHFFRVEGDLERRGNGVYDVMNGVGAHEVVIETSQHIANMADLSEEQITKVLNCYAERITDLEKDTRLKYVLVFKNFGKGSGGGGIRHARSQLIATPVNPKRVKEELAGARQYYDYHERCVFCDLI